MKKLSELILCSVCLLILGAILAPLMAAAKGQGDRLSICFTRNRNLATALGMYMQDEENRFPPSSYRLGCLYGNMSNCKFWPEILIPYHNNWLNYRCPEDPNATDDILGIDGCTGVPATTRTAMIGSWAYHADRGLNWQFLSPMVGLGGNTIPNAYPVILSRVNHLESTILLADSIFDR